MAFSKIDARWFVRLEVSLWVLRLFVCFSRVIVTWCRRVFLNFLNLFEWDYSGLLFFLIALLPFICSDFAVNFLIAWVKFVWRSNSSLPFSSFNEATAFLLLVTRFVFLGTAHQLFHFIVVRCRIIFLHFRLHEYFSCSFSICGQKSSVDSTSWWSKRWILGPIFDHVVLSRWNPRRKFGMFIGEGIILIFWNLVNCYIIDLVETVFEIGILDVITLDTELWLSQIECIFHPVGDHFINSRNFFTDIVVYSLRLVILVIFFSVWEVHTLICGLNICSLSSDIKWLYTLAILHDSCFSTLSCFYINSVELKMIWNIFEEPSHEASLKISCERNFALTKWR